MLKSILKVMEENPKATSEHLNDKQNKFVIAKIMKYFNKVNVVRMYLNGVIYLCEIKWEIEN